MADHLTCPCNTKEHQNYLTIFQNYWGKYIQKNGLVYNMQNVKTYWYIICYWSLTEKTNHLKLITVLITFNLIALFIKTRHVLKTSQSNLTKGPWTQGLQNIFQYDKQVLLHRQSSDCTSSLCSFRQCTEINFRLLIIILEKKIVAEFDRGSSRITSRGIHAWKLSG